MAEAVGAGERLVKAERDQEGVVAATVMARAGKLGARKGAREAVSLSLQMFHSTDSAADCRPWQVVALPAPAKEHVEALGV